MGRYDRDDHITIVANNIHRDYVGDFGRTTRKSADVYGLTYDYGSVMHYSELSGSKNGKETMLAKDRRYQKTMGSEIISFSDIFMINEHYGCNKKCNKATSAKCANEGYPHPRNCSVCICPSGYGGPLCDQRPPTCGEDLVASTHPKTVLSIIDSGTGLKEEYNFCNYWITAPKGKKIEIDVQSISDGFDDGGCPMGGLEVKTQEDQKLTGYRFCSKRGSEGPIVSKSNRLPVIAFGRSGIMKAVFMYRFAG